MAIYSTDRTPLPANQEGHAAADQGETNHQSDLHLGLLCNWFRDSSMGFRERLLMGFRMEELRDAEALILRFDEIRDSFLPRLQMWQRQRIVCHD